MRKRVKEIQGSVTDLTNQLDNLNSHIRTGVKKEWKDDLSHFETKLAQLNRHLDTLRNDLAAQKVCTEDAEKAAKEYTKLAKKKAQSEKVQRDEIDALSTRVTELEEKLNHDKASLSPEDEGMSNYALSMKIAELEEMAKEQAEDKKKHQAVVDGMLRRFDDYKADVSHQRIAWESNRASLQRQLGEHTTRLAGQSRWIDDLREKLWLLTHHGPNPSSAPPAATHNNQQRH